MGKVLGIDYGEKRIGLSISDEDRKVAFPYKIIDNKNKAFILKSLLEIIKGENITDIVIGIPLSFNFTDTDQTKITKSFFNFVKNKITGVNVYEENEILSTKEAYNWNNKTKRVDDVAASLILQSFLDKLNSSK